jgi:hypothetical protein
LELLDRAVLFWLFNTEGKEARPQNKAVAIRKKDKLTLPQVDYSLSKISK